MNTFGNKFRISIFGESHGPLIGIVIDGVRAGIKLSTEDFNADLDRRRSGLYGTTTRQESDIPEIITGIYNGFATGAPLTVLFCNKDTRPADYEDVKIHPRPSHADWTAIQKYDGFNDPRGGGHFSGRLTAPFVAAGIVAKKMLDDVIRIDAKIVEIGGEVDELNFQKMIDQAIKKHDSIGGIIECTVSGVPPGLGEPFFDSVESVISHLLFSIPGIKGVEFGSGFSAARMYGSEHNDMIISADGRTATNNAGGINGGLTNGNNITLRVAVKPTSSIGRLQKTFNMESGREEPLAISGRHDACIALRMPVIIEAAVAIALAQF